MAKGDWIIGPSKDGQTIDFMFPKEGLEEFGFEWIKFRMPLVHAEFLVGSLGQVISELKAVEPTVNGPCAGEVSS